MYLRNEGARETTGREGKENTERESDTLDVLQWSVSFKNRNYKSISRHMSPSDVQGKRQDTSVQT